MTNNAPQQPAPLISYAPPMSLEEARRVIWPFDARQPMGLMLDQRILTRSKLQWAAEKAKWPDVCRAAQTLIEELERQETAPMVPAVASAAPPVAIPAPSAIPPLTPTAAPHVAARVVIASKYLEKQESLHGWMLVYYGSVGLGALLTTITSVVWQLRGQTGALASVALFANIARWIWLAWLARRRNRTWRNYRAGHAGEDRTAEQLRTTLDHHWTIYRNLQLPDRKDDLDLVLVGPGGVWAVQVKATSAPLRVQAGRWQVRRGGLWVAAKPNPGAQITRQATALNDFFKRNGLARFVERAVALAAPQPFDQFIASEIPVWLPFDIERRAQSLATRFSPPAAELARINDLLGQRAVEQRAVEGARKQRR